MFYLLKKYLNNKLNFFIIINYIILLFLIIFYTDISLNPPNLIYRILFSLFFFSPFFIYPRIIPFILLVFFSIRLFSVAPFNYIPSTPEYYFLFIFLAFLNNFKKNNRIRNFNILFICLILIPMVSKIINFNVDYLFLMFSITMFILVSFIYSKFDIYMLELGFILVSFVLSVYALVFADQFLNENSLYLGIERSYWTDPNYLGGFLSFGIICSFFYSIKMNLFWIIRLFLILILFLGLIALGILASRGAFISCFIPIVYIWFKSSVTLKKSLFNIFFISAIIIFASFFVPFDALFSRFNDDSVVTGNNRFTIWSRTLDYFSQLNPVILLFGGGDNFSLEIGKLQKMDIYSPHNNFLQMLYDYGLLGVLAFIYLIIFLFNRIKYNILSVSLLLSFVLSCFTLVPLTYFPFWFILSYLIGVSNVNIIIIKGFNS